MLLVPLLMPLLVKRRSLPTYKGIETSARSLPPTTPSPPSPPRPLREPVPSHQAKIERVVQTANTFRMVHAQAPSAPDPNPVECEAPEAVRRSLRMEGKSALDVGSSEGRSALGLGRASSSTYAPAPAPAPVSVPVPAPATLYSMGVTVGVDATRSPPVSTTNKLPQERERKGGWA